MNLKKLFSTIIITTILINPSIYSIKLKAETNSTKILSGKENPKYIENEIIIKFNKNKIDLKEKNSEKTLNTFSSKNKLTEKSKSEKSNISVHKISNNRKIEDVIKEIEKDPNVEYAEPNYLFYPSAISINDPYYGNLWGLHNTGQTVVTQTGTPDSDIDAPEAWNALDENNNGTLADELNDVVVGIIDSGIDYTQEDLDGVMWNGATCVDTSGDALGGCVSGYDFGDDDKDPIPNGYTKSAHGTHVAGIIAGEWNSSGIRGIAPNVKLMALKVSKKGFDSFSTADIIEAIEFAEQNGAKVINASFGGSNNSQALKDTINNFSGIFITAAGNSSKNHESYNEYPCDFDLDNIICVTSTDGNDALSGFSDYGISDVDIAAPGKYILSSIILFSEIEEDFTSTISDWTQTGYLWTQTYLGSPIYSNVLFSEVDTNTPYSASTNDTITSNDYDFDTSDATKISYYFQTGCDSEETEWDDYITLELKDNTDSFDELLRWNEGTYNETVGDFDVYNINTIYNIQDSDPFQYYEFQSDLLDTKYIDNDFQFRYTWTTDADDNNYKGCYIDNIIVSKYTFGTDESNYGYQNGTSMATPYVSGLAAMLLGYNNNLDNNDLKNLILSSGDKLDSLNSKTLTEKRLNAFNATDNLQNNVISNQSRIEFSRIYDDQSTTKSISIINPNISKTFTLSETGTVLSNTVNFSINTGNGNNGTCGDYPIELAPDESCSIDITFNPSLYGNYESDLKLTSTDPDLSSSYNVILSAEAIDRPSSGGGGGGGGGGGSSTTTPTSEISFPDISGNTFERYIDGLAELNIVNGYSDGTYRPEEGVTRAQMAKYIVNAFGFNKISYGDYFSDVSPSHVLADYIITLKNLGIVTGYGDGNYGPDDYVTRGQVTKFIVEAMKKSGLPVNIEMINKFPDVIDDYTFAEYINYLTTITGDGEYVIQGYSDGTYKPDETLDRGQMAKIVYLTYKHKNP